MPSSWARLLVAGPEAVEAAVQQTEVRPALQEIADDWVSEVVSWSDGELNPPAQDTGGGQAPAESVARGLHKLLACKDEYEVASLHLEEAASAALRQGFGSASRCTGISTRPSSERSA